MLSADVASRLRFLSRVVHRECVHLKATDSRLFSKPFSVDRALTLDTDGELSERVEAFVARFGRLQDTLGDKLIPLLLRALDESVGATVDNLDRAERLGWLTSADEWLSARKLRNQMVHEYIEDAAVLAGAIQAGHGLVDMLVTTAEKLLHELYRRGWIAGQSKTDSTRLE